MTDSKQCWNFECSYNFNLRCEHRGVAVARVCPDFKGVDITQ